MSIYSRAELNVIAYLERGLSNQAIGENLFICEKTVKFHLTNIYKKEGVKSRSEFMAKRQGSLGGFKVSGIVTEREDMSGAVQKLEQGARNTQVVPKSQEDKINFIDEKFHVGDTIGHLHKMMKEVTKEELTPNTVNAACNCVARLNETINTAIMAAKFLNDR